MSAPAAEQTPVWWLVCCYDCPPCDVLAKPGSPVIKGLVMPFGHDKEPGDYTPQAVEWVNAHGDGTGHTDIIMTTNCVIGVAQIPVPRYGLVALPRPRGEFPVKAMTITPLGPDGEPNGEPPVKIHGAGTVVLRRTFVTQGDPS